MNLLEKLHALAVSEKVRVWHYHHRKGGPPFVFWTAEELAAGHEGHWFDTLEAMIEAAYAAIDPMNKPLPPFEEPPRGHADERATADALVTRAIGGDLRGTEQVLDRVQSATGRASQFDEMGASGGCIDTDGRPQ